MRPRSLWPALARAQNQLPCSFPSDGLGVDRDTQGLVINSAPVTGYLHKYCNTVT